MVASDRFSESRSPNVTDDTTFTGDPPSLKIGNPNTVTVGGNPITVTIAAPGTRLWTPVSSVTEIDTPRGSPPLVVENVTASSACSYCSAVASPDSVKVLV